jgi:hypothetical protein
MPRVVHGAGRITFVTCILARGRVHLKLPKSSLASPGFQSQTGFKLAQSRMVNSVDIVNIH